MSKAKEILSLNKETLFALSFFFHSVTRKNKVGIVAWRQQPDIHFIYGHYPERRSFCYFVTDTNQDEGTPLAQQYLIIIFSQQNYNYIYDAFFIF